MPKVKEGERPLTVDLPDDLHTLIDNHQFDIRVKSRKEAVADLIRRGREAYEAQKEAPESK